MQVPFAKYSGCGNDFIIIDNRAAFFPTTHPALIAQLCQRRTGIGADGIILLENSTTADFRMRIFNADGSEAEMCGNGARCLMKFIQELGIPLAHCTLETKQDRIRLSVKQDLVSVEMPLPSDMRWNYEIPLEGKAWTLHSLNTGVPHAVLFVDDLEADHWMTLAPKFRYHHAFSPKGTNVNFARVEAPGMVRIRTYERGVENETLSCGTGAVATAIAASRLYALTPPIIVWPRSNDSLQIDFEWKGETVKNVTMTGPAIQIFRGELVLK